MSAETKYIQTVALEMAGVSNQDIMKQVNFCKKTIFKVWKRYQEVRSTLRQG